MRRKAVEEEIQRLQPALLRQQLWLEPLRAWIRQASQIQMLLA